jgi:CelD/BcsL family acetyltransferase involved in cellulose biosynthesis
METVVDTRTYEVTIARHAAQIDSLQAAWTELLERQEAPIFNAEPDRLLSLVRWQQEARPHVILLEKQGTPAALVVGSIERVRLPCRIGYKSFLLPPLKCFTIIHRGLLGEIDEETSALLLDEIGKLLRSGEADMVFFHYLNTASPFVRVARARISGLRRSHCDRVDIHRTMTLPGSMDAFYQSCSKKHRANLRRYVRKIEEQYGPRAVITRYRGEADVDSFVAAASQVSAKTYQHGLGCGLENDERTRDLIRNTAQKGWWRGHVMFLDGQPCAFQLGAIYRGSYFLEQIGFDPKWKDLNVGTVLFLAALEDLCQDNGGAKTIDFGFGEADYKKYYGDKCWTDASFYLFAPRLRPLLANLVFSGTSGLSLGLAHVLEKTGAIGWIKRRWRHRLSKKEPESAD